MVAVFSSCYQKFVARKARKAQTQKRLSMPALELACIFGAIAHAPRDMILQRMLPVVEEALEELKAFESEPAKRPGYWDDWCLARYLEGVCMRFVAYPVRTSALRFWISADRLSGCRCRRRVL